MTDRKICYIVGASDFCEVFAPRDGDLVIAADGGYDNLLKIGAMPDLLIGDLDSIKNEPRGVQIVRYPVEKDETDAHLAYRLGFERGYRNFVIFGGTGGRLDHTLANLSLLLRAKLDGADMQLVGGGCRMQVIKDEAISLEGDAGKTVSVFACGGVAEGVCIKGLKYEADIVTLSEDFALGVSNSFTESGKGSVSVKRGSLLLVVEANF